MKVKAKNVDKLLTTKKANGRQNDDSQEEYIYIYIYRERERASFQ